MKVKGLEPGRRAALLISEMQMGIIDPAQTDSTLAQQMSTRGTIGKVNALERDDI